MAPPAADTAICAGGSSTNLRDITSGPNGKCGADCTAAAGDDLVTGLGSPISPAGPPSPTSWPAFGSGGKGAGYWQANRLVMALALVWLAHIGLDRLLGMGLKYSDRFTHTYLGDRPDAR